jgi:hypothetical protein
VRRTVTQQEAVWARIFSTVFKDGAERECEGAENIARTAPTQIGATAQTDLGIVARLEGIDRDATTAALENYWEQLPWKWVEQRIS